MAFLGIIYHTWDILTTILNCLSAQAKHQSLSLGLIEKSQSEDGSMRYLEKLAAAIYVK